MRPPCSSIRTERKSSAWVGEFCCDLFCVSVCLALPVLLPWSNPTVAVRHVRVMYRSTIEDLDKPALLWKAGGTPLTQMMNMERRKGKMVPVIKKALTQLDGCVRAACVGACVDVCAGVYGFLLLPFGATLLGAVGQ